MQIADCSIKKSMCVWHVELLDGQSTLRYWIEEILGLLFRGGGFLKPKMLREFPDPITGFPLSTSDEIGVVKAVSTLQDIGVPLNGIHQY